MPLTNAQKERLEAMQTEKSAIGALKRKTNRIESSHEIFEISRKQIKTISTEDLFLMGVCLYWAEGSKQSEISVSAAVGFSNSDWKMLRLFMLWLDIICQIKPNNCVFELYLHEKTSDTQRARAIKFWTEKLEIKSEFIKLRLKRNAHSSKRKIITDYNGVVKTRVRKSTNLNRQITGWIEGIFNNLGSGVIGNTSAFGAEVSRFES